jgi:hypothetical protein
MRIPRALATGVTAAALTATAVIASPATANASTTTSWPANGTGGLNIRNSAGTYLGSGIGEDQTFQFLHCGPSGSGLIYIRQLTRGHGGGWGSLYKGYVKQRWTQLPSMFPCNGH